jgi:DNA-binding GntR family transcriptional regulator
VGDLAADRPLLGRTSTAERVADILRGRITEGFFPPGTRLSEDSIGAALGVSRNTLREAFRLLGHERLLVHELNRGVFVRKLTIEDVVDLYRVRKLIECAAVRDLTEPPDDVYRVGQAIGDAEAASMREDWVAVGTANLRFHQALVALAGSPRMDEVMTGVLAELRLVFHVMADPKRFHEPYIPRNRLIFGAVQQGDGHVADTLLRTYLDHAERELVDSYRAVTS